MIGAVLAGGYSRRMGTDKALVEWEGRPLWQRQTEILRLAGADPVAVVRRPDQIPLGERCWLDRWTECGPLAGLEAALSHCPADSQLAVLAVDMPGIDAEWFAWLTGACGPGRGAVAQHASAFEPLAAIYPAGALSEVTARLERRTLSLQPLIGALVASGRMTSVALPAARLAAARSLNFRA